QYPDSAATDLKRALVEALGLSPGNILVGSGSTELIRMAALAYFKPGDQVLIITPTFGEYEIACRIAGASVTEQRLSPEKGFRLEVNDTIELIQKHRPSGIFITNPNNPTSRYLSRNAIERILVNSQESLLILDEAYLTFVDNSWSSLDMIDRGNLLILRSMTKDYALAGLRLGYGIAHENIIDTLSRILPPWNVNAVAQQAGIIALKEQDYVKQSQAKIKEAKEYLITGLARLGLPPLPSEASFFLVKVNDSPAFRHRLLEQKMLVRDCTSFGLPGYIRIAPRTMPECQQLIKAIEKIRGG
ncbi:MAG: histidinol-phosphate aminotransferase family protein, partial [Chloroflexi bacterium]|nr:histidinol-phosphate aminotransferase family protein [Chloroflexota bacterium]